MYRKRSTNFIDCFTWLALSLATHFQNFFWCLFCFKNNCAKGISSSISYSSVSALFSVLVIKTASAFVYHLYLWHLIENLILQVIQGNIPFFNIQGNIIFYFMIFWFNVRGNIKYNYLKQNCSFRTSRCPLWWTDICCHFFKSNSINSLMINVTLRLYINNYINKYFSLFFYAFHKTISQKLHHIYLRPCWQRLSHTNTWQINSYTIFLQMAMLSIYHKRSTLLHIAHFGSYLLTLIFY